MPEISSDELEPMMNRHGRNLQVRVVQGSSGALERSADFSVDASGRDVAREHRDRRENAPFDVVQVTVARGRPERTLVELAHGYGARELLLAGDRGDPGNIR